MICSIQLLTIHILLAWFCCYSAVASFYIQMLCCALLGFPNFSWNRSTASEQYQHQPRFHKQSQISWCSQHNQAWFSQHACDKLCAALLYSVEAACSVNVINITALVSWLYVLQGWNYAYICVCGVFVCVWQRDSNRPKPFHLADGKKNIQNTAL